MERLDVAGAIAATKAVAAELGLSTSDAIVLRATNKLALHLLPCDAFARVAPIGLQLASFEVQVARALAVSGCPVAALDPRVEARPYEHDGFDVSFWTYYEPDSEPVRAAEYGAALLQLHAGMRTIGSPMPIPHYSQRTADPSGNIVSTPLLDRSSRNLLSNLLRDLRRAVMERGARGQLIHGEPHVGNVLNTSLGPVFIDLETCCIGPIEFDLAHAPVEVSDHYPSVDHALLEDCRGLVLATIAKHRCGSNDRFPDRRRVLLDLVDVLRVGPPWPALEDVMPQLRPAGGP